MENLNHLLAPAALVGSSSMTPTNTVTDESAAMTAPGSASEQTLRVPRPPLPWDETPHSVSVLVNGDSEPSAAPWTAAGGGMWHEAADETPAGVTAPRDALGRWRQL